MIFILFFLYFTCIFKRCAFAEKKIISSCSDFSFLNAEIAMVIPDELTKEVLYCYYTTLELIIEGRELKGPVATHNKRSPVTQVT